MKDTEKIKRITDLIGEIIKEAEENPDEFFKERIISTMKDLEIESMNISEEKLQGFGMGYLTAYKDIVKTLIG